jgi:transcriptional regulator of arginine metabolism
MAKLKVNSAGGRQAEIAELIREGQVASQSAATKLLKARGYDVTQATVSRDLEDLGAVRQRDADGVLRYHLGVDSELSARSALSTRRESATNSLIQSLTASGNLVVIATPPGGAQLLASALDSAMKRGAIKSLIGTIAGDDTVLAISKSSQGGAALAKELATFSDGAPLKSGSRNSTSKTRTRARK